MSLCRAANSISITMLCCKTCAQYQNVVVWDTYDQYVGSGVAHQAYCVQQRLKD